ncbi:SRPBCC family protein [Streptomyces meridianus]|uniref:SRPBCC family protein n=1 Tax=Streptomyces meridianus TaxID=2938945 RepID=A0ABT0XAL9_9ACTN|nr:SRPBCC family protein [Streptomyces meridianus]MCM2579425.1 SRPBCC family protein [Streptomyces meridianus]
MDWCSYRFRSLWDVDAPPDAVFVVLGTPEEYPLWWPQVREVARIDDTSGRARFRSVLPYDLVVTVRKVRHDPAARVLEVALAGDLDGWARWTVAPCGGGTRAVYDQQVEVRHPLMRVLAVPGRPLFRANHALMMRAGLHGLRVRLAAG